MAVEGIIVNGLFLNSGTPVANQRGIIIDDKFFIPLVDPASLAATVGVLVDDGGVLKFQPLSFNGTTAVPDGALEDIGTPKIFNTGEAEPDYPHS